MGRSTPPIARVLAAFPIIPVFHHSIFFCPVSISKWGGLRPFTFQQLGVSLIEFQALPGPEERALRAKTMRQHSFSGLGGRAILSLGARLVRCRGGRPGARRARLNLRKHGRISGWISFPADAFSAQRPSFRAQACFFCKKGKDRSERGKKQGDTIPGAEMVRFVVREARARKFYFIDFQGRS